MNKSRKIPNFSSSLESNVRKINCTFQGADSCEQLSDFSEHPKNKGLYKPHLLRCGALCFFDLQIPKDLNKIFLY